MPEDLLNNERDLLLQVSEGNEMAFRQLFDAYRNKLFSYILRISQSKESAEDAVHDVFLKLWTNRERLTEIENLNAYIFRMAQNHAYNGLRKIAKETLVMAELEKGSYYESSDPDDLLVRKEIREFIHDAIEKLTPQQKEVYRLSREQGLKHEEIAQRLNISVLTVKKHMSDALHFLRKDISDSYGSYAVAIFVLYSLGVN